MSLSVSDMYDKVYEFVEAILGPGVNIEAAGQNVSGPVEYDELGRPVSPYITLSEIPTSSSFGYPHTSQWVESSPGSVEGTQNVHDDYTAIFEVHQVGGRGELIQKIKASISLLEYVNLAKEKGISCLSHGPVLPVYTKSSQRMGPDCMCEIVFAGRYTLSQDINKVTDVGFTLDANN